MGTMNFKGSDKEKKPAITKADFGGKGKAVGTVVSARFVTFKSLTKGQAPETNLFVEFEEWPEKALRCNGTMANGFKKLVEADKLPADTDDNGDPKWTGCKVPMRLVSFNDPVKGGSVDKPVPVHPDEYDDDIANYERAMKKARR